MNWRDKRLWEPDETCEPFLLECFLQVSTGKVGVLFTVDDGEIAVFSDIGFFESLNIDWKRCTMVISDRIDNVPGNVTAWQDALSYRGSLTEVVEFGSTNGLFAPFNAMGWADYSFIAGVGLEMIPSLPRRMYLKPGRYMVYTPSFGISPRLAFSAFGWTFRERIP